MKSKRTPWIDVVKGLGIIFVIIGHCHRPDIVLKVIQAFHMPLFFILSGYLFSIKNETFFENTKKIAKRYLKPYALFGLINYIFWLCVKYLKTNNLKTVFELGQRYLLGLLYSRGTWYWMPNCSPIWFLTSIFMAYIFFRIIIKQKRSIQFLLVLLSVIATYLFCNYEPIKMPWNIDSAIWGIPFMYLGYSFKTIDINLIKRQKPIALIACIILLVIGYIAAVFNPIDFISMDSMICGNLILSYISSIGISCSLIIFVILFINRSHFLELLGRNTIIILGFNYLVNFIVYEIWDMIFLNNTIPFYWIWQCIAQILLLGILAYIYEYKKNQNKELY